MSDLRGIIRDAVEDLDERCARYDVTSADSVDPELRRLFLDHLARLVEAAAQAAGDARFDAVARQGHSIKGMGGSCGAAEISVAGEELERLARSGSADRCLAILQAMRAWRKAAAEAG